MADAIVEKIQPCLLDRLTDENPEAHKESLEPADRLHATISRWGPSRFGMAAEREGAHDC